MRGVQGGGYPPPAVYGRSSTSLPLGPGHGPACPCTAPRPLPVPHPRSHPRSREDSSGQGLVLPCDQLRGSAWTQHTTAGPGAHAARAPRVRYYWPISEIGCVCRAAGTWWPKGLAQHPTSHRNQAPGLAPYPAATAHGLAMGEGGRVVRCRKKHKGKANVVRKRRTHAHRASQRAHRACVFLTGDGPPSPTRTEQTPVLTSQMQMVWSSEQEAATLPSAESATALIASLCPSNL